MVKKSRTWSPEMREMVGMPGELSLTSIPIRASWSAPSPEAYMKLSLPNRMTKDDRPPTGVDITVEHKRKAEQERQTRRTELGGWSRSAS